MSMCYAYERTSLEKMNGRIKSTVNKKDFNAVCLKRINHVKR